jgi:DNA polymerase IV
MPDSEGSIQAPSTGVELHPSMARKPSPRLDELPIVFVLPTHLSVEELEETERLLTDRGGTLTYEIIEAGLVLGSIETARRAKFELNIRHVRFETLDSNGSPEAHEAVTSLLGTSTKRKRADDPPLSPTEGSFLDEPFARKTGLLKIVKLAWLHDSIEQNRLLGLKDYIICAAKISQPGWSKRRSSQATPRQNSDLPTPEPKNLDGSHDKKVSEMEYQGRTFQKARRSRTAIPQAVPTLVRENTSEHELALQEKLPGTPAWVKEGKVYACERVTLASSPNSDFLDLLEKIRVVRTLIEDQIGIRAYSTSIASLAAYPYKLSNPREIERLPGCEQKISALFREYQSTGQVAASQALDEDPTLRVVHDFYNIWGVGARTAREWYFERGWRDHDDIIQYGWSDLSRVQQIGLKFFDEFERKISRAEVESIGSVIEQHAKALTDSRMTSTIVGGYRRGKSESGDVDIILSHPDEANTHFFISRLVTALEDSGWITHTLTLAETNSQRNQQPLGLRVDSSKGGFDTLDKALLVWQDPEWPGKAEAKAHDPKAKNPNVHRRVDIIISPWRTVGCAIAGWSSGTTFQRDLRRFAKHKHGWKFDSSGVRDRKTGRWVDLERWTSPATRAQTPLEAERRVFEGLGLDYREPWERCTR